MTGGWYDGIVERPTNQRRIPLLVAIYVTLGLMFLGNDWRISFTPLDHLGMPYPHVLRYAHVILPGLAFTLWIILRRSNLVAILAFIIIAYAMAAVPQWAERQPVKIPMTRMIGSYELETMAQELGFRVSSSGGFLLVDRTPGRAEQVLKYLDSHKPGPR